jgi:hypothetical protein
MHTPTRKSQTVELGRYVTDRGEERMLVGRRGQDAVIRVFDLPMADDRLRGRSYFVETGFESRAELAIFRRRYLEDAERFGDSPMSRRAIDQIVATTDSRTRAAIC